MEYFRENNNVDFNSLEAINWSYDLQAGSYTDFYYNGFSDNFYIKGEKISMKTRDFYKLRSKYIANIFNNYEYFSILEVGVGEATTLCDVVKNLKNINSLVFGIDISVSRIHYGNKFLSEQNVKNVNLSVGNMFEMPFCDNQFDIVFMSYTIEQNTDKSKEAIKEIYRVTNKYMVLIESSYTLGNTETKKNIEKYKYCKDIFKTIKKLKLNVIEHRLFEYNFFDNQSSIIIIEKQTSDAKDTRYNRFNKKYYHCPRCKYELIYKSGCFYCRKCLVVYPIIKDIPILLMDSSIIFTKFLDDIS